MSGPILAATAWPTNAHLIEACAQLGYLKNDARTLDPTYGKGVWWKRWRPESLVTNDLVMSNPMVPHPRYQFDFRHFPDEWEGLFDQIAYDPPYVCIGGRKSTGMPDFHAAYGLSDTPKSPKGLQQLINDGLTEMRRLVRPKGIVLVKCQAYVSSGKLWLGDHHTLTHALALGFECVDRMERISYPRPQPTRNRNGELRVQVHARRNLSTLFVLRAPK